MGAEATFTIVCFGCGTAAMWLCQRDGREDNLLSVMLFLFGPFSLAFAYVGRKDGYVAPRTIDVARLLLSALYAIGFLQWMGRP